MKIIFNNHKLNRIYSSNHIILIILSISLIFAILGSRWTILGYGIPEAFSKRLILFLYFLLAIFFGIKLVKDYFYHKYTLYTAAFHIFFIYCFFVITIRLITGGEVKNTIYWTIIMLGSISVAEFVLNSYKSEPNQIETVINDFTTFGLFVVAYKILYVIHLYKVIPYDPLNTNKECCIMLITIPCSVLGYLMYGRKRYIIGILLFSFVILYSGSRGGFLLLVFEFVMICALLFKNHYKTAEWLLFIILFVIIFSGAIILNVGNIQDYIIRALGTFIRKSSMMSTVIENISRSDAGRNELYEMGYMEFMKSPLFGTGVVYFRQTISGMGEFNQSAHNFILETLDCFGLLGLIQLIAIYVLVTIKMPKYNRCKSYFVILSLAFFGYSMVEPFLYDPFVFLTYCIAVVIFKFACKDKSIDLYKNNH